MDNHSSVRWQERMIIHLERLAAKMLQARDFYFLKTVAELMAGLDGPGWSRLSDEDRERYLEQMRIDFHPRGMGDSQYGSDADYLAVCELIDLEYRAVKRRLRA